MVINNYKTNTCSVLAQDCAVLVQNCVDNDGTKTHNKQALVSQSCPIDTVERKAAVIGLSNPPSSHRNESGLASTTCYKITTNTLTEYTQGLDPEPESKPENKPPVDNAPSGEMTDKVSARLKNAVRAWQTRNKLAFYKGKAESDCLNFITLTLPAKQAHTDKYLKDKPLRAFLNRLEKDFDCKRWIWKAERQKNYNLHFHILVDRYIPWRRIRDIWNSQLNRHGYIDNYEETWLDWDKDGFRYSYQLERKGMDYNAQVKAYHNRLKHGYRDPNTTDIHATQKVKNIEAYFIKYVAKNDGKIDGKVWGYSGNVQAMTNYKTETNGDIEQLRSEIEMKAKDPVNREFTVFNGDYFSVYSGPILDLVKKKYPAVMERMMTEIKLE
jgi:hypothetical protein